MGTLKQDTFICGLHVYTKKLAPGDQLNVSLYWLGSTKIQTDVV